MSLTDRLDDQQARLIALKAAEVELIEGPDAALAVLGPPADPIRMRTTLGILLRAGRHKIAGDLIRDQHIDDKWIDLAVLVFAIIGEIPQSRLLVERADNLSDLAAMRRCHLAFAEGVVESWHRKHAGTSLLALDNWPKVDVELARTVIELLDPLLLSVRANRRIDGDFELQAVTHAVYCTCVLGDRHLCSQLAAWLLKYIPVPLIVAELSLRGLLEPVPQTLPNRLRAEYPLQFQASFLAAMLDRDIFRRFQPAFDEFVAMSAKATDDEHKKLICGALFETCGQCGLPQIESAIQIIGLLRPSDARSLDLLNAIKQMAGGNLQEAKDQLERMRDEDDGLWWQVQAQLFEKQGDEDAAQQAWEKASETQPHPEVVRRSIQASIDRRKYASVVRGIMKLLESEPDNKRNLNAIAWAYVQLNDHANAAIYLSRLVAVDPSDHMHRLWLAQSLARTLRVADAIAVLQPALESEDAPVEMVLFQSELLEADNKPVDAFRLLESIAPDHWDEPAFLLTYMHRGHAAGNDRLAHDALARLMELRQQGKVAHELLQEGTLEQLLECEREHRSRRESLQQDVVAGRMPWLFAEEVLGNSAVWAWVLHTQDLKWLVEEPLSRAALSIYATNAFIVQGKQLEEIVAPKPGQKVVADLTALLTLHKLGRLSKVAEYFGCLLLPASYGELRIRDAHRFGQHQPSREEELREIRERIDRRRIHVSNDESTEFIVIDEYSDDVNKHVCRIRDIIAPLISAQRVSPGAIAALDRVAHKPSGGNSEHASIALGEKLLIDLMTLRTLAKQEVFDAILDAFEVHLRASQNEDLIMETRAHETARDAKSDHDALWNAVTDLVTQDRIRFHPLSKDSPRNESLGDREDRAFHLDSIQLAQQLALPIIVDDRVLQIMASLGNPADNSRAFGSDCAVLALLRESHLSAIFAATDFRQLIRWRYRFLVPDADILIAWAEQFADNLPGDALLDAAAYLHDCIRDPGLHCGLEQTEPPIPMAAKFVAAWIQSIVTFLAQMWNNEHFSIERLSELTRWIGEEMIPSCPHGLWLLPTGHNIVRMERTGFIETAVLQFATVRNQKRANLGLRLLADGLGLDEEQYLTAVVTGILAFVDKEGEADRAFDNTKIALRMMQNALYHRGDRGLDAYTVVRLQRAGLLQDVSPVSLPDGLVRAVEETCDPNTPYQSRGPLILLKDETSASVIGIENLLMHPSAQLRQAAVKYMQASSTISDPWLSERTKVFLKERMHNLLSEDKISWQMSAIELVTVLREDLFAHLGALQQSNEWQFEEGINENLNWLLRPTFDTLAFLRPPLWAPTEQVEELRAWIEEASKLAELELALTRFLDRWGYIPLAAEFGAPKLVERWMNFHNDLQVSWDQVWSWANLAGGPLAKYHAITIALHVPSVRPNGSMADIWTEIGRILNVTEYLGENNEADPEWQLYCELATHFARHIEALHPGQDGERAACYAWWLTTKLGKLVVKYTKSFLEKLVTEEARYSQFRWIFSRSPVAPSGLRHATLHVNSIWAMSLLAHLSLTAKSFTRPALPDGLRKSIGKTLHGYLVTSNLMDEWGMPKQKIVACQQNFRIEELCSCEGFVPEEDREALAQLVAYRRGLSNLAAIEEGLAQFMKLPSNSQVMTVLALKNGVYSSNRFDELVSKWLENSVQVVDILLKAPDVITGQLLELLAEFQQHPVTNWATRLPHLLAYAVEKSEDASRTKLLAGQLLQMSINGGCASAIQRLVASRRWADWHAAIQVWRENLIQLAKYSEPWISARVRAISAVVSRLIGPWLRGATDRDEPDGVSARA